jgi:hypothetical protein
MTRTSGTVLIAALVMLAAPCAALAQSSTGAAQPGTNGAGAAQSSGPAPNREPGVTTGSAGLGSGNATPPPTTNTDTVINDENKIIDSKLKGICRGC